MAKKIIIVCLFFLLSARAFYGQDVRVAIKREVDLVSLKIEGKFKVYDSEFMQEIYSGRDLVKSTVRASSDEINIGKIKTKANRLEIQTARNSLLYINGRPYRNKLIIISQANKLLVINKLDLDSYIKGVVAHEVAPWWPIDALKAQSVVARTYALYHMQFTKNKEYDMTADIYSQVYGGQAGQRFRSNKAVDATKGEILTYKQKLIPAYYHATCAGNTENAKNLWKIDLEPISGVKCKFCKSSPHIWWRVDLALEDIETKLAAGGWIAENKIADIKPLGRNSSGRVQELKIILNNGKILNISAKDFRQILGPNLIRSTNFSFYIKNGIVHFEGLGWGHGVGFCQWGAYFMARQGYGYKDILKYYYPNTQISTDR